MRVAGFILAFGMLLAASLPVSVRADTLSASVQIEVRATVSASRKVVIGPAGTITDIYSNTAAAVAPVYYQQAITNAAIIEPTKNQRQAYAALLNNYPKLTAEHIVISQQPPVLSMLFIR